MTDTAPPQPEVIACVDSTNRLLAQRALAEDVEPYTSVVARHQRSGQGRLGRSWYAPADSSLLCSVLVTVPDSVPPEKLGWVPLGAALALADLIKSELSEPTISAGIKWPNDLYIGDKKVGGILSEFLDTRDGHHRIVVGVGLNLTQSNAQLEPFGATSLRENGWDGEVTSETLRRLASTLTTLLSERFEDFDRIPAVYSASCTTLGESVDVTQRSGEVLSGLATEISPAGGLVVARGDQKVTVTAGEVTLSADPHSVRDGSLPTTCEECQ